MTKDEFLLRIERQARGYELAGKIQEWLYWIGSALAAICSAIAGLSIVANSDSGPERSSRIVIGILAIVPAVWAALDRAIGLRQLSIFNYGIAQQLQELRDNADASVFDEQTQNLVKKYHGVMATEHSEFIAMINGTGRSGTEHAKQAELGKNSIRSSV